MLNLYRDYVINVLTGSTSGIENLQVLIVWKPKMYQATNEWNFRVKFH